MQKKLMAVAVAGALALPGVALAQNVSVSGFFKIGLENIKIGQPDPSRAGLHDSEMRVADNSSRMIFNMNEDLSGGLQAIGQIDLRFEPDNGAIAATGNTWAGLRSATAGTLTFGRHDLHYGKNPSDLPNKAGALKAAAVSIMDYMPAPSGTGATAAARAANPGANSAIANATRTPNAIKWDSPNWSGFAVTLAYSTNSGGQEADLTTGQRKGSATNINPSFTAANFKVEYSNWRSKKDAPGVGSATAAPTWDEKGDTINAWYSASGLKVGIAWNKSSLEDANNTIVQKNKTERTAWTIPVNYSTGAHDLHFHYSRANKVKFNGSEVNDTGAKMMAAAYVYNLSKRTTMGVTYAKITNDMGAAYNFFTDSGGGLSSAGLPAKAGEDPQLLAVVVRNAF